MEQQDLNKNDSIKLVIPQENEPATSIAQTSTTTSSTTITTTTNTTTTMSPSGKTSSSSSSSSTPTADHDDKFIVNEDNELIVDIGPQAALSLLKEHLSPMPLSPRSPRISPTLSSSSHRSPPKKYNLLSIHHDITHQQQQQQQQQQQHHSANLSPTQHHLHNNSTSDLLFKEPLPHSPRRSLSPLQSETPFIGLSPLKSPLKPNATNVNSPKCKTPIRNKYNDISQDDPNDITETASLNTPTSTLKSGIFSTPNSQSPFKLPNGSTSRSQHKSYPSTPTSAMKRHHHHNQPVMPTPIRKIGSPITSTSSTPLQSAKKRKPQPTNANAAHLHQLKLQDYFNSILVFCCVGCNAVVGDSTMLIEDASPDQEQFMIDQKCYLMSKVAHCILESNEESLESFDNNNNNNNDNNILKNTNHIILSCQICSNELGYRINTQQESLSHFNQYFILNSDSVSYYQLGSGKDSFSTDSNSNTPPIPVESSYISNLHGSISFLSERVANLENSIQDLLDIFSEYMDENEKNISVNSSKITIDENNQSSVVDQDSIILEPNKKQRTD